MQQKLINLRLSLPNEICRNTYDTKARNSTLELIYSLVIDGVYHRMEPS